MNKIFVNNIGDLAEAQRASFYQFLSNGINEELENFPNPFSSKIKLSAKKKVPCLIYLHTNKLKLKGPNYSIASCLKRDLSYTIQLYVSCEYSYSGVTKKDADSNKTPLVHKSTIKQDIFFGELPLMTEEGTFIISGCERVIISQIIRSPGIYFRKEFGTSRKVNYTATIISNKGPWTKVILDEKPLENQNNSQNDRIYIKLNDFRGTSLNSRKGKKNDSDFDKLFIFDLISHFGLNFQEIIDSSKYPLNILTQQRVADMAEIDPALAAKKLVYYNEDINARIKGLLLNQRSGCFSIGQIGRYKINKKLGLNLPKDITYLTAHDFIGILDGLIELKYHDRLNDDIDDIKNKQIRCVGELLQNQIRVGLFRLSKNLTDESSTTNNKTLSFDLDNYSDPDEWILDPRPITSSLREFFKTSQLSQFMDQINPLSEMTHKRRISVFGPNGLKRDHISSVIRDIHPSQYGRLCPVETPEGLNAGLITSMAMLGRIGSLGSIETPYFFMKNNKVFTDKKILFLNPDQESETKVAFSDVRLTNEKSIKQDYLSVKENYVFSVKKKEEVNFITTSPIQVISLATALIPFIEHDDANRALMGSNMQRQAVPLLYTQKPIIGTGLECAAILDSGMVIKNYSQGVVSFSSTTKITVADLNNQKISYFLKKYNRSNQETCINQKPIVWPGEEVYSGQIIADGPSTNDGELSLGRNLMIAYMPWEGYNYEDAIVINEKLILEDYLTSVHIHEYETNLTYSVNGSEKLTRNLPHLTNHIKRHLDENGVVKIGSYIKEHDILIGKLTPCEEDPSPEAKLLRALYNIKDKNYRDTSLRAPYGTNGRVIDVRIMSTTSLVKEDSPITTACQIFRIYVAQIRKIKIGDKLAGRHGNKGIISRVLPSQDMPYLPDGTPIDIIFNPLGVPSRMNVGQVFECLLGLAGEKLGTRFKISPFDEVYGHEASRILTNQKLKEAAVKTNSNWLFNPYHPGKILLRDGRTGEYFDNPITVGKTYILKLIHLVDDKIHARATGPYSMITEQPLAGKSQKGGQRFGEMEVWALEAYGCSNTLQELLTIKSDDIDGRNDIYEAVLVRKETEKPNPSIPESFLALIRELNSLGLDFSIQKFEGGFNSTTNMRDKKRDIFTELEDRLMLRALLARKKTEQFAKLSMSSEENEVLSLIKQNEKKRIIEKLDENEIFK